MDDKLEAVYYPHVFPRSRETLTLLGLIFDKVHIPGVGIDREGVDHDELARALEGTRNEDLRDQDAVDIANCRWAAHHRQFLDEFVEFTGTPGKHTGASLEEGAQAMAYQIENLIFGEPPPPPEFLPMHRMGVAWPLTASGSACVRGPLGLEYSANAILYAYRTGHALVGDDPWLPVPAIRPPQTSEERTKMSSMILALTAAQVVLEGLPPMSPEQIVEFRHETREVIVPFRAGMLKMSGSVNAAIREGASIEDILAIAEDEVRTQVIPGVAELRARLTAPTWPWHEWLSKTGGLAATLAVKVSEYSSEAATLIGLAGLLERLTAYCRAQHEKEEQVSASPCYYLLQMQEEVSGKGD